MIDSGSNLICIDEGHEAPITALLIPFEPDMLRHVRSRSSIHCHVLVAQLPKLVDSGVWGVNDAWPLDMGHWGTTGGPLGPLCWLTAQLDRNGSLGRRCDHSWWIRVTSGIPCWPKTSAELLETRWNLLTSSIQRPYGIMAPQQLGLMGRLGSWVNEHPFRWYGTGCNSPHQHNSWTGYTTTTWLMMNGSECLNHNDKITITLNYSWLLTPSPIALHIVIDCRFLTLLGYWLVMNNINQVIP